MTSTRPLMPTGWSWTCPCGWSTSRSRSLEQTENTRAAHIRLHDAAHDLRRTAS